jgi:phage-related protein
MPTGSIGCSTWRRGPEAVYVLHAFAKKRQATPNLAIDLARARLKELFRARHWD